ncbi:MAG: hypothetical protein V4590_01935 [Bacteroidota bacterium]
MSRTLRFVALLLLFLLAIVFSFKQLIEPDLWWQLRTGEWIFQTKSIPHADPFSFTYTNTPWQNIKWGYEIIIAGLSNTLGVEMLMLLQVVCSCLLVYLLLKFTKLLAPETPQSIVYFIIGLSFIAFEYRITGRSESISQVLFLIVCYLLLAFRYNPTRHIWWVPAIMMCWANLHEAFAMGLVALFLFTVTVWVEALYTHTQTKQQAFKYTQVSGLSLLAICVNPNHIHILLKPFEFAGQVYQNKYTSELSTYAQPLFWTKEAWITLSLFVGICIITVLRFVVSKSSSRKWARLNEILPLPYVAFLIVLVYIASTGHRNIVFATLVFIPLFVAHTGWLLSFLKVKINDSVMFAVSILVFALLYITIVTNRYYAYWNSTNKYGLEIPAQATPIGAANFLEANHLLHKPIFSDYLSSSYLMWRLQPEFKTFIDLRDLDIFPMEHFDRFTQILSNPTAFEQTDSQYHFQSVVLLNLPQMQPLHAYLYSHPNFHLVYLDALCCVYSKDSMLKPIQTYSNLSVTTPSAGAYWLSKLLNPGYVVNNLGAMDQAYPAAEYFYSVYDWSLTKQYAQLSIKQGNQPYKGLVMLGQVAYQQALADTTQYRVAKIDSAIYYMQQALSANPDYVPALIDLGTLSYQNQQYKSALNYLEKACDLEPQNLAAHNGAAEVYKIMAGTNNTPKYLEKAIEHFIEADYISPHNPEIMLNLGFLYYRLKDCNKAVPYLEQILNYPKLTDTQRARAKEAIQKCN